MSGTPPNAPRVGIWNRLVERSIDAAITVQLAMSRGLARVLTPLWSLARVGYANHRIAHLRGPQNWGWVERGVIASHECPPGARVLDLGCGDGTFDALFFSPRAQHIDALDLDARAINAARRRNARSNIRYAVGNILEPFPGQRYDLVVCMATMQFFTPAQTHALLDRIAAVLCGSDGAPSGKFVGMLANYRADLIDPCANTSYRAPDDVRRMLSPHFADVRMIILPPGPTRTDVYFVCSGPRTSGAAR